jgi:hypothetical protein
LAGGDGRNRLVGDAGGRDPDPALRLVLPQGHPADTLCHLQARSAPLKTVMTPPRRSRFTATCRRRPGRSSPGPKDVLRGIHVLVFCMPAVGTGIRPDREGLRYQLVALTPLLRDEVCWDPDDSSTRALSLCSSIATKLDQLASATLLAKGPFLTMPALCLGLRPRWFRKPQHNGHSLLCRKSLRRRVIFRYLLGHSSGRFPAVLRSFLAPARPALCTPKRPI